MAKDANDKVTGELIAKPGRPSTGKALSPAERQRASRAKRRSESYDTFPASTLSLMLSPEASKALRMLSHDSDMSQKVIIEKLLISAYETKKNTPL